ncbi:MAG: UPF0179 family protein [Methanobrevibacter sp.]|uniref:UPF0179 family protein n=1 Tax=Methanobrevibacter sp. TaxID=66852 RepID=UPI0026DF4FD2|nr:UPF0179 family protein [Methanobrevibacter sp.]MDO5849053.1 UPF0179 family protein [Methanobrevibacter sp.]
MITLIGKDLAKKGTSFIFYGPAEECESCRFKSSCVDTLERNRMYEILDVRDNEQKCPIHEGNTVVPVEVEKAPIELLTNSRNIFEGSTFQYIPIDCDEDCEYREYCVPEGLVENDKCIIVESEGKHKGECKKGYRLNKITLAFVV